MLGSFIGTAMKRCPNMFAKLARLTLERLLMWELWNQHF